MRVRIGFLASGPVAVMAAAILLATSATGALAVSHRGTDTVGDADGGPDIVAVETTITSRDELLVTIEMADPLTDADGVEVWLETGLGPGSHPLGDPPICNGWFMEAAIRITSGGAAVHSVAGADPGALEVPIPATIDGETLTVSIPLSLVDMTDTLYVALIARSAAAITDRYPDEAPDGQGCHRALLPSEELPETDTTLDQQASMRARITAIVTPAVLVVSVVAAAAFLHRRALDSSRA